MLILSYTYIRIKSMTCGIYRIRNKVNDKTYIGSSIDIEQRWYLHKIDLKNKKHHSITLQRAWNKYGESNFEFYILEIVEESKELIIKREQYYLDLYRSYIPQKGYNISPSSISTLGMKHSEEVRRANSLRQRGIKPSREMVEKRRVGILKKWKENKEEILESRQKSLKQTIAKRNNLFENKDWLFDQYVIQKKSVIEIARDIKIDKTWIYHWLHKHEIPIRSKEEQNKIISDKIKKIRAKKKTNLIPI